MARKNTALCLKLVKFLEQKGKGGRLTPEVKFATALHQQSLIKFIFEAIQALAAIHNKCERVFFVVKPHSNLVLSPPIFCSHGFGLNSSQSKCF